MAPSSSAHILITLFSWLWGAHAYRTRMSGICAEDEDELRPVALTLIDHLIRLTEADDKAVRFRSCDLLAKVCFYRASSLWNEKIVSNSLFRRCCANGSRSCALLQDSRLTANHGPARRSSTSAASATSSPTRSARWRSRSWLAQRTRSPRSARWRSQSCRCTRYVVEGPRVLVSCERAGRQSHRAPDRHVRSLTLAVAPCFSSSIPCPFLAFT